MPTPSFFRPAGAEFLPQELDSSIQQRVITIEAADGPRSRGILYAPEGKLPKTVLVFSHPSADLLHYWPTLWWTAAGYASFNYGTRTINNFTNCVHELLMLDVAGVVKYLREEAGFENIILFGKSGGASLFAYYQAQASMAIGKRVSAPPGGGFPDLNDFEMPQADGALFVAGHPGQGRFLQGVIDPSVVDENDPLATDQALDMYDERNGWREPPEPSRYDPGWLALYRAAQIARVRRLDAIARSALESSDVGRLAKGLPDTELPAQYRRRLERQGEITKVMVIHRTGANPGYADPTIDPSDRVYGSIHSSQPHLQNYGFAGFGRILTADAWLSTWSGISSFANLERNLPDVKVPSYFVFPRADEDIFPSVFEAQIGQSGADDKEFDWVSGLNHNLRFSDVNRQTPEDDGRETVMRLLLDWLNKRFPPT